jgi:hypothetical protein
MPAYALDAFCTPIAADSIPPSDWEVFKARPAGDFRMLCCRTPAVLKNSPLNVPFFAHLHDECSTAPETAWHIQGKTLVMEGLRHHGLIPRSEVKGATGAERWCADVLVGRDGRTIAIELQRSYQTLAQYRRRQERYRAGGVECYWLVRPELLYPLSKSCARYRLRTEFDNKFPEGGFRALLSDLPLASLSVDPTPNVVGPNLNASMFEWLKAVLEQRYAYDNGQWLIQG